MDRNLSSSKHTTKKMKELSELSSLLPHQPQEGVVSLLPEQVLAESVDYIKKLQEKLEKLKHKKSCLMRMSENSATDHLKTLNISISVSGSALDVVLRTGLDYQFMYARVIRMLHEEGAEVVNASFSVVDDTIFHNIHSEVNGEHGLERVAARISERLRKFVSDVD
ncbi:uncharacterized protein LOC105167900 [Sesamum indicum]|uniref:Uncharacterized protein LOC105167900 n=1 Tax=Sesamum indicum TaxID=4182 RepID=A0A6I9TNE1_SESIN|nr:uncharacterized protein LOC105167900 [Sesamum indicum]